MRRFILVFTLIAAALPIGCAASGTAATTQPTAPTAQQQAIANVDEAINAYKLVLTGISAAEAAGWITPSEVAPFQPVLDGVAAALQAATTDAIAGNASAGQTALDEVTAALPKLAPLLSEINTKKSAAAAPSK